MADHSVLLAEEFVEWRGFWARHYRSSSNLR